ncbi:MAG TPA: hypothetical protein VF360_04915 [Candidatus Methanoperedens sp.]
MTINKIFVYLFIIMLIAVPASASDATLNRWVLNVTLNEDGIVDELIQVEIGNAGSSPMDGFSFVVPASNVTVIYDFDHTYSSKGEVVVEQLKVQNGIKLTVNFNPSLNSGETWNGRIGFRAENFAKISGDNYTIEIPLSGPQAIASGKTTDMNISPDVDLRGQVFLPKGIEVVSVTPKPFRILFQNSLMVPTWTPMNLKITDTISLKGSVSNVLKKIADVDERSKNLSKRIREANTTGLDVGEAQMHLKNAEDYNTNNQNSALVFFLNKDDKSALEFVGYAENELNLAEKSFSSAGKTQITPTETVMVTPEKSPAPGAEYLVLIIISSFMVLRTKRPKP